MVRRMNALIWSRFQMILANKMVSVNLFMPIMMVTMLLPMFSLMDKTIEKIIGFTYLGSYSEYSVELADYQVFGTSFLYLILWLVGAMFVVVWLTRQKQVNR